MLVIINHTLQKSIVTGKLRLSLLTRLCVAVFTLPVASKRNHKLTDIKQQINAVTNQNCQNIFSMLAIYS